MRFLLRLFKTYRILEEQWEERGKEIRRQQDKLAAANTAISKFLHHELTLKRLGVDMWDYYGFVYGYEAHTLQQIVTQLNEQLEQQKFEEKVRAVKCKKKS